MPTEDDIYRGRARAKQTTPRGFVRTNINLTPAQHETLRELAFKRRTDSAALIREAVDQWLARQPSD